MNLRVFIREIIEKTFVKEAEETKHSIDRISERIKETDIASDDEFKIINNNLQLIRNTDFPINKSFAILLNRLRVKKDSPYYVLVENREYYRIIDNSGILEHDSTGNEVWVIIRENEIKTVMLRKDIQTKDAGQNCNKLHVDYSIKNPNKYIINDKFVFQHKKIK